MRRIGIGLNMNTKFDNLEDFIRNEYYLEMNWNRIYDEYYDNEIFILEEKFMKDTIG